MDGLCAQREPGSKRRSEKESEEESPEVPASDSYRMHHLPNTPLTTDRRLSVLRLDPLSESHLTVLGIRLAHD